MPNRVSSDASASASARGLAAPGFFFAARGEHGATVGDATGARHYAVVGDAS